MRSFIRKLRLSLFIVLATADAATTFAADAINEPFAPGSVWMNDSKSLTLTLHERNGESFRATFDTGKYGVREIKGTVNGKLVSWFAKDVTVQKGKPGDDNFGTLAGDSIHFVYKSPGSSKPLGTFILNRVIASAPAATPSQAAASPAQVLAIQTDASQPRIQVIKDQGPNATEWALTPLEEAIPQDIRQNLTYLREDLLDEGKKSPKAAATAYALASDYCDKILSALSQREISRVNAGYRTAQADAGKNTSTQALDARRNHQMSWPQYAREEAQRAALRENEAGKADVKKEKLKVEWAARAEQMRLHLDALYRQFREAMR